MKKEVKASAKIKLVGNEWELYLTDRPSIIKQCLELFKGDITQATQMDLKVTFTNPLEKKTPAKLGYFYAEILPRITAGLKDAGYYEIDDHTTYLFLCKKFLQGTAWTIEGELMQDIKTLSDVGDTELREFMDKCIKFGNTDLHVTFRSPEEYKNVEK